MITKAEARRTAKRNVALLGDEYRQLAAACIEAALFDIPEFAAARKPFIFLSRYDEPDTARLIKRVRISGGEVRFPRVAGGSMRAVIPDGGTNALIPNKWGISEPSRGLETEEMDVAIVPVVAFDGLRRVGHGGGYYDRFLAGRAVMKIGIAFDCQRVEDVESLAHDVPMDVIVTERRIIFAGGERENKRFPLSGRDRDAYRAAQRG